MRIRKGDKVIVIAGKDRNKIGVVEHVFPAKNRVVIAGINMVKKSLKRTSKTPQGGVIDIAAAMNASNVMLLDASTNKPTRVGYSIKGKEKNRISKVSSDVIKETK